MSALRKLKYAPKLSQGVMELVCAGQAEPPKWLGGLRPAVVRNWAGDSAHSKPRKSSKLLPIRFPEDGLIRAYYDRHPEARMQPVDLRSFTPPPARRFALRQLALMRAEGISAKKAYHRLKAEQGLAHGPTTGAQRSVLASIQEEEEQLLSEAMQALRAKRGSPTGVQLPPGQDRELVWDESAANAR